MTELAIKVDEPTQSGLRQLSEQEGSQITEIAERLLARAVRAAKPRPVYDVGAIRADMAEFADEDLALAESDLNERADVLAMEDRS
jgi:hypothetical protein